MKKQTSVFLLLLLVNIEKQINEILTLFLVSWLNLMTEWLDNTQTLYQIKLNIFKQKIFQVSDFHVVF